jgi:CII-binding regulator of phage lambda lysogenization HflD
MSDKSQKKPTMQRSASSLELADSTRWNPTQAFLNHHNDKAKERKKLCDFHREIEAKEHQKADQDLDREINSLDDFITLKDLPEFIVDNYKGNTETLKTAQEFLMQQISFGLKSTKGELKRKIDSELVENKYLSTADRIIAFKNQLTDQGKPPEFILKSLITKFEKESAFQIWVDNWKKFLRLSELSSSKSPTERKAIQQIIGNADFSDETAFEIALESINENENISLETKYEIAQEFDGNTANSIAKMDAGLKYMETRKAQIESTLSKQNSLKSQISNELSTLREELNDLAINDPKKEEIEQKIAGKKQLLSQTKSTIKKFESEKPLNVSYPLRKNFLVKLNSNGSRSIILEHTNFEMRLATNSLPFMGTKNLRCVNLSFVCDALFKQGISKEIFSPNLVFGAVPNKSQRDMGHLILSTLGYDDRSILSENDIPLLKTDLSRLTASNDLRTGRECLTDLRIYDPIERRLDKIQLKKALRFIRENRDIQDDVFFEKLEKSLNKDCL